MGGEFELRLDEVQTHNRKKPRDAGKLRQRQRVPYSIQRGPFKPANMGNAGRSGCLGRAASYLSVGTSNSTFNSENGKRTGKAVLSPVSLFTDRRTDESRTQGLTTLGDLAQLPYQSSTLHSLNTIKTSEQSGPSTARVTL